MTLIASRLYNARTGDWFVASSAAVDELHGAEGASDV